MKLIIDISKGIYKHIETIQNGSIGAKQILNAVKDGIPLVDWIPIDESLPEECVAVLVNCPTNKNIFCAYLEKGKWFIFSPIGNEKLNELVTAWMPLPNRYKEE